MALQSKLITIITSTSQTVFNADLTMFISCPRHRHELPPSVSLVIQSNAIMNEPFKLST